MPGAGYIGGVLSVSVAALDRMKADAEAAYPHEACGLLAGNGRTALEAHTVKNLNTERARDRYLMDAADQLRIEKEVRSRGHAIVGSYHSHPDHPSLPSEEDRQRAEEVWGPCESWSYVILEVANGPHGKVVSWRSWVLKDGRFAEEAVQVSRAGMPA